MNVRIYSGSQRGKKGHYCFISNVKLPIILACTTELTQFLSAFVFKFIHKATAKHGQHSQKTFFFLFRVLVCLSGSLQTAQNFKQMIYDQLRFFSPDQPVISLS